jgi:hypothetical protein
MTRNEILQQQASARTYQARFDSALESWGLRARGPNAQESPDDYRRDQMASNKKFLPFSEMRAAAGDPTFAELRRIKYWEQPAQVLNILEPQLLRAIAAAGKRNDCVPPGEMREVHERGPNGEHHVVFRGAESFVKQLGRPGRRVTGWNTPQGFVRANGSHF